MKPLLGLLLPVLAASPDEPKLTLERAYSLPRIIGTAPSGMAWSPDGRKLAFLWNEAGYDFRDLYLLDVAAPVPQRITNLGPGPVPPEGDPGVTEVVWHPDGVRLLLELGGKLFLLTPGVEPELLAEGSHGRFSADGTRLAHLEAGDLWVLDLAPGAEPRRVVSDPRGEVFVSSFSWSPRGQSLAFLEIDERRVPLRGIPDYLEPETTLAGVRRPFPGEEPRSLRLGIASLDGSTARELDLGGEAVDPIFSYRWSPAGDWLLVDTSDLYVKKRRLLAVEPGTGSVRELLREEDPENVTAAWQAEWAPDGSGVYFLSDRDEDYHVYLASLAGGAPRRITRGDFAVAEIAVRGDSLFFVANAPRPEERHLFRVVLEGGEPVQLSRQSGTHSPVVSPDGRLAAVAFSSDLVPPELFLTSLEAPGSETRVTSSPLPEFSLYTWVAPEYVSFESHHDDATLHGRLLVPNGLDRSKKHPAIVGSIYSNTVRNQWGGRNAHPLWGLERVLLQKGYVLFNLDVRGSWGRGKAFRRGIRLDYGGIDLEDIESAVRYLSSLPFVDSERIGIWGSSYGGLLTSMSLFRKPHLFRAGVAGAPATNVFHALTGEMRVMMAPQDHAQAYQEASAFTYAEGLQDPLLIIHGMRDRTVLYKDSVALVDRLMRLGKNVDFVTLPDAGHGWDLESLFETRFAFRKLVEFFDRHLGGGP